MNNIDLRNFVNIDIKSKYIFTSNTTRDTVVLYTPEGLSGREGIVHKEIKIFNNMYEVEKYIKDHSLLDEKLNYEVTQGYLKVFFENGGIRAEVHEGISYSQVTKEELLKLPNDKIYVCACVQKEHIDVCTKHMIDVATQLDEDTNVYGINKKIIITASPKVIREKLSNTSLNNSNLVIKYTNVLGGEMSVAAYLSKIDISKPNSVEDYAFTKETSFLEEKEVDDVKFKEIMDANMNVDVYLAGSVRNCGGNIVNGQDLVNEFIRIILHQTLTDAVMNVLTEKIKNSSGVGQVYSAIAKELEKYRDCGYLTTDKIWTDEDWIKNINGENYPIVKKGDALLNGYLIKILPLSSLTAEEIAKHQMPKIYVLIADQYSIRKININGNVI